MRTFRPTPIENIPLDIPPNLAENYVCFAAVDPSEFPKGQLSYYKATTGMAPGEDLNITYCIHGTGRTHPHHILERGFKWQYLTRIGRMGMGLYAAVGTPHYSFWGYMHRVEAPDGAFVHTALILRVALPEKHKFQVDRNRNIESKFNYELPGGKYFASVEGYTPFVDEAFRANFTTLDTLPDPHTNYGTVVCVKELSAVDIVGIIAFAPKVSQSARKIAQQLTFQHETPQPQVIQISDDDDDDDAGPAKKTQKVQDYPTCVYCKTKGPHVERIRNPKYNGEGGACGGWCSASPSALHYYGETCPTITYEIHPLTQLRVPITVTSTGQKVMIVQMNGLDIPNNQRGFKVTKNGKSASASRWESQAHGHYLNKLGNFYDILAVRMN